VVVVPIEKILAEMGFFVVGSLEVGEVGHRETVW
jgi:hypothetical protein